MSNYMDMKRNLAKALDEDQENCRCNDMTNAWCVKIAGQREICTIAPDAESAAIAIRAKMEEASAWSL